MPIKEEEDSEADLESDASGTPYVPEEERPARKRRNGRQTTGRRQSQARRVIEDEDEEEDSPPSQRSRYVAEPDDEDDTDELAMGRDVGFFTELNVDTNADLVAGRIRACATEDAEDDHVTSLCKCICEETQARG